MNLGEVLEGWLDSNLCRTLSRGWGDYDGLAVRRTRGEMKPNFMKINVVNSYEGPESKTLRIFTSETGSPEKSVDFGRQNSRM